MMRLRVATIAAAVALALAGCTPTPPPAPTPTPKVTASADADVNAHDPATLRDGGMVRLPVPSLPASWNPWRKGADQGLAGWMLEPLRAPWIVCDPAGRPTPNPDLLASASADHTGGRTVVTLRINDKAVWGDGTPIRAADWVATWKALSGRSSGVEPATLPGWKRVAATAAGASEREVVITYTRVDPDWAEPLVDGPARVGSVADAATFNRGWSTVQPGWFAGPFVLTHVDRTQGVVTLARNPRWWGATPRLTSIVYRAVPLDSRISALRNNEFDYATFGFDTSTTVLAQARTLPDVTLRRAPSNLGRSLLFRTDTGPLADARVRRAVVRAIDRTRLAGTGPDSTRVPLGNHLLFTNHPGYTDQSEATGLTFDVAGAGKLLEEAGWTRDAQGRWVEGGVALKVTISAIGSALPEDTAPIATMLAEAGFQVTRTTGEADIMLGLEMTTAFPLSNVADLRASGDLAGLLRSVATQTDETRRADEASRAARLMWQQATSLPLDQDLQISAVKSGLANLGAPGFGTVRWERVGWTR